MKKEYIDAGGVFGSFTSEMVDQHGTRIGVLGTVDLDEQAQHGRIFPAARWRASG